MSAYIAHNYSGRFWLRQEIAPALELAGVAVTSRWIFEGPDSAEIDVEDVRRAEDIILFTNDFGFRAGRGKFVELGIAIALGKRIILVGEEDNCIFYKLPGIIKVKGVQELLEFYIGEAKENVSTV